MSNIKTVAAFLTGVKKDGIVTPLYENVLAIGIWITIVYCIYHQWISWKFASWERFFIWLAFASIYAVIGWLVDIWVNGDEAHKADLKAEYDEIFE